MFERNAVAATDLDKTKFGQHSSHLPKSKSVLHITPTACETIERWQLARNREPGDQSIFLLYARFQVERLPEEYLEQFTLRLNLLWLVGHKHSLIATA